MYEPRTITLICPVVAPNDLSVVAVDLQIAIAECAHLVGHVKHEMMHIMGFYHEHSRYSPIHSPRFDISI